MFGEKKNYNRLSNVFIINSAVMFDILYLCQRAEQLKFNIRFSSTSGLFPSGNISPLEVVGQGNCQAPMTQWNNGQQIGSRNQRRVRIPVVFTYVLIPLGKVYIHLSTPPVRCKIAGQAGSYSFGGNHYRRKLKPPAFLQTLQWLGANFKNKSNFERKDGVISTLPVQKQPASHCTILSL